MVDAETRQQAGVAAAAASAAAQPDPMAPASGEGGPADLQPEHRFFRTAGATDGYLDKDVTVRLGSSATADRVALAVDPHCPIDAMYLLSKDGVAVREALAANPSLPARFHPQLAEDCGSVALALLGNPHLSDEGFAQIVKSAVRRKGLSPMRGYGVRMDGYSLESRDWFRALEGALSDPRCPEAVLAQQGFGSSIARQAVLRNPACPPDLLHRIAVRYNDFTCAVIPENPAASLATLMFLAVESGYEGIRDDACRAAVARGAGSARTMLLGFTARRRQSFVGFLTDDIRREFARDEDPRVRYPIAAVTRDSALLSTFAKDPHGRIRRVASRRLMSLMGV